MAVIDLSRTLGGQGDRSLRPDPMTLQRCQRAAHKELLGVAIPCCVSGAGLSSRTGFRNAATATILALSLTACQTGAVHDRVVEVDKPVATRPIKAADVPTPVAPLPKRPDSLSAAADVLLSKWCEAVAYMLRADPLLRVSAGVPQQPLMKYPECEGR